LRLSECAPVKFASLISNEIFNGVKIWDLKRIYSNIENLVLWARSEITGSALKIIQSVE
jgi:hypothetical protein